MDETEKEEDVGSSGPLALGSDSNSVDSKPNSVQGFVFSWFTCFILSLVTKKIPRKEKIIIIF